jgi:DNA mismatch repair protein MutL
MPPDLVDVNVHPTKAEVRFREGQRIYRQLLSAIRTRFLGMDLSSELTVRGPQPAPTLQPLSSRPDPDRQRRLQEELVSWVKEQSRDWGTPGFKPVYSEPTCVDNYQPPDAREFEPATVATATRAAPQVEVSAPEILPTGHEAGEYRVDEAHTGPAAATGIADRSAATEVTATGERPAPVSAGNLRAMQIHDAYLVVETDEGLTVVDQHALHERVLYEHLRNRVLAGTVESQRLVVPLPVELATAEAAAIREHVGVLEQFGLLLEEFGANTVLIRGYPVLLSRRDPAQIVRFVAESIVESNRDPERRDMLDGLLHMLACKGAIKAGQRLTPEEIDSLLDQRHLIDDAHHCPHGRPTALVLSRTELDRQFGRLG